MKAGTSWNLSAPTVWKWQRGNRVTGRKVIRLLGCCEHCFLARPRGGNSIRLKRVRDHQVAIVGLITECLLRWSSVIMNTQSLEQMTFIMDLLI